MTVQEARELGFEARKAPAGRRGRAGAWRAWHAGERRDGSGAGGAGLQAQLERRVFPVEVIAPKAIVWTRRLHGGPRSAPTTGPSERG